MNFAEKLTTSWELMKRSLRVIRANPRLALFPVVSAACTVVLALFFFAPVIVTVLGMKGAESWLAVRHWDGGRGVHGLKDALPSLLRCWCPEFLMGWTAFASSMPCFARPGVDRLGPC